VRRGAGGSGADEEWRRWRRRCWTRTAAVRQHYGDAGVGQHGQRVPQLAVPERWDVCGPNRQLRLRLCLWVQRHRVRDDPGGHCPADNSCDAEHALCVAGGGGGSRRPPPPPPPSPARPPPPPPATGLCEDDAAFRDGASLQCSDYRGYGCDDTSSSGGTASAAIKAACPLSCGICSGEFRQPLCVWDATYTFQRCCDTASGPTGNAECWYAETQYASCCLPEEGQAPRPPPPPSPPSRPPPPPPVLPPPPPPAGGCVSQPCQNAGVCAEAGAASYSCECPAGFAGDDCEDDTSTHSDDDASHDTADDTCYPCPHYIPAPTETPCDDWMAVRKTPFRAHFML